LKTAPLFQKIGMHPHHGICVPLFSLHTSVNPGRGEFLDLIPLIDWMKKIGFDTLQLLPINDSGIDPSPYNPISSCALDPIYLSLSELGIPSLSFTERTEVLHEKLNLLHKLFQTTFSSLAKTDPYQTFLQQNPWVFSYAKFKALKEQFADKHWLDWSSATSPDQKKVDFYTFLQFHAFRQMALVRQHANTQGIFLKGDIPILLSPDSADVWENPHLFHLDLSAGAPPDLYNQLGQNWGFPLFNWEAMRKEQFHWWKQRLKVAEKCFHIYRIDHVVGFFRIWGIEKGEKASEGSFFPPNPDLWAAQGTELLEMMIDATSMLPMAEDLGTIPPLVYPILKELGICGTKVIRWQKVDGRYIPFNEYEPLSLTTLSTPDMEPLELWWKNSPSEAVPFAEFMKLSYHPVLSQQQRLQILSASHHTSSLFHINLLQEYLALFPELISPHSENERINVPGTLLPSNWTYRFHPSIEEMSSYQELITALIAILA
jgi:4-alpha-glucanotransferase